MIIEVILGYLYDLYRIIRRKLMGKDIKDNKLKVGIITKVYPEMDSLKVKFRDKNKTVLAKMLHRCYGGIVDFYTPEGEEKYSDEFKQNYIVPNQEISCIFVKLGKNEYVVLGFYDNKDKIYDDYADNGCYKLTDGKSNIQYKNGKLENNILN